MKAAEICAQAATLVSGDRDRAHGAKRDNFRRIAAYWSTYLRSRRDGALPESTPLTEVDVAHMMVLMKIARTQSGALNLDDYIDAAGYAGCGGELAAGAQAPQEQKEPTPCLHSSKVIPPQGQVPEQAGWAIIQQGIR